MGLVESYCKLWEQGSRYERLLRLPRNRLVKPRSRASTRRATHVRPAVAAEAAAAYEAGESVGGLAEHFGLHRTTIANLLDNADVARRPKGLTHEQVREAVRLYADGLSVAKVAARFGLSPNGMDKALKRAGVVLRNRHWRTPST